MRFNKLLILSVFIMVICCVSVASATDVDNMTVPDDIDVIEIDDAVDSVDEVELDDSSDDVVDDTNDDVVTYEKVNVVRGLQSQVTRSSLSTYFDTTTGYIKSNAPAGLQFVGTFSNVPFDNFIINRGVALSFSNAVFNNVGFKLLYPGLVIDGATFNMNAPANKDCYTIDVESANNVQILNNVITYTCGYSNADNYNYVIKVKNSAGVKIAGNTITASLPLKTVKHYVPGIEGLDKDFVAGVGVTDSNNLNFTKNTIDITANRRVGDYPTLDAFIMWYSNNSYIGDNEISVIDEETVTGEYSYIYGVDLYKSDYVNVHNNTITMNADQSGGYVGGNGTGAAYCVQCTGPYTGVIISDNTLTTQNNGPNAAIYSQNWDGATNITVSGNTIEVSGKGTSNSWDVLTGMELQDTYATVTGNTISVTNRDQFSTGNNIYGISYCQYTPGSHTYIIIGNDVDVDGGRYTIFLLSGTTNTISGNTLHAYDGLAHYTGTQTIKTNG